MLQKERLAVPSINKTHMVVKVGVLSAISFVLMMIEFPIPILFPAFLQLDLSEIPVLLGTFSMGPAAGVAIELIKNLLHLLLKSQTGGVGELAGFLAGSVFAVSAGVFYLKHKTKKAAAIGLAIGTVLMAIVMSLANYFIMLPFFLGGGITSGNLPIVFTAVFPFNLVKGMILSAITLLIYKKVSPVLHR